MKIEAFGDLLAREKFFGGRVRFSQALQCKFSAAAAKIVYDCAVYGSRSGGSHA
jgi:hypothetical protein